MSDKLLKAGVFVTGFGFPVVPEGTARIRVQISAALTKDEMDRALRAFESVGRETGLLESAVRYLTFRDRDRAQAERDDIAAERLGVLNPACARLRDGSLRLYPRMVAPGNISRIGSFRASERADGVLGVELPRLRARAAGAIRVAGRAGRLRLRRSARDVRAEPLDRYVMAYVAFGPRGPEVAVAVSRTAGVGATRPDAVRGQTARRWPTKMRRFFPHR